MVAMKVIPVSDERQVLVRKAARALARAGLVTAYGHCSTRLDDSSFLVCTPISMGLITPTDTGTIVPIQGALPPGVLGEVRGHQQIYARRPDVNGICRVIPPKVQSLGAMGRTPKVRHGLGCYFAPQPAFWSDPQLLRSEERAIGVAETLGQNSAVVMRGNGAIVAADRLEKAVVLSFFLEDSARVELDLLQAGYDGPPMLPEAEAKERATWEGRVWERMWDFLTHGDPE